MDLKESLERENRQKKVGESGALGGNVGGGRMDRERKGGGRVERRREEEEEGLRF